MKNNNKAFTFGDTFRRIPRIGMALFLFILVVTVAIYYRWSLVLPGDELITAVLSFSNAAAIIIPAYIVGATALEWRKGQISRKKAARTIVLGTVSALLVLCGILCLTAPNPHLWFDFEDGTTKIGIFIASTPVSACILGLIKDDLQAEPKSFDNADRKEG